MSVKRPIRPIIPRPAPLTKEPGDWERYIEEASAYYASLWPPRGFSRRRWFRDHPELEKSRTGTSSGLRPLVLVEYSTTTSLRQLIPSHPRPRSSSNYLPGLTSADTELGFFRFGRRQNATIIECPTVIIERQGNSPICLSVPRTMDPHPSSVKDSSSVQAIIL